ncbi:hypothetical protein K435DRAFT_934478 [Dendrothele bispora CBS 962.96]|uniref:Uncharacterized protein n=1 Tax=Dendrothele bispora (strain CBS 962.96) TaxID=1314807 RepID=A0A4S8L192_DENBC|nr:hypothetical protein K435DRAFT_934478 [Dendrothele bispora CBS 962.96]
MDEVSYDVNKDGVKVAVFTLTKAAYRLGGTVQDSCRTEQPDYQGSGSRIYLDTHESLPTALACPPSSGSLNFSPFMLSTLHTKFSLDIPSDTSTVFQIKVGNEQASGVVGIPLVTVLKTWGRAYSTHKTSYTAASTAVSTPGYPSSSSTNRHRSTHIRRLPNTPIILTFPASAPADPSTFSLSSPSSPAFLLHYSPTTGWIGVESEAMFVGPFPSRPSEESGLGTEDARVKGLVRDDEVEERNGCRKSELGMAETNQKEPEEVKLLSEREHIITARVKGMVKSRWLRIFGFFNLKALEVKAAVKVRTKTRIMGICGEEETEMDGWIDILCRMTELNLTVQEV